MAALDFPTSPTLDQVYTANGKSFKWNGVSWINFTGLSFSSAIEDIFWENATTVTSDYTISANTNAGSFGPITIADGITVEIPAGSTWSIV